jgi:predicted GNAT family N-acyltransferase
MDLRLIEHGSTDYLKMVALRTEILRKPLGLAYTQSQLDAEFSDILIGAFENDEVIGCCILTHKENNQLQLRQMAVANAVQGKGIGSKILLFAEGICKQNKFTSIMLHARDTAFDFYKKSGYQVFGEMFFEVSIPHFNMEKLIV